MESKRKRQDMSWSATVCMAHLSLLFIVIGLLETVWTFDDWYFQPDYITDSSGAFFSGALFLGLAFMMTTVAAHVRSDSVAERYATRRFLFLIVMVPIWSIAVCVLQHQTINNYKTAPFGVCYAEGGHGRTYMYVKNSDWCQHFGYRIAQPSSAKKEQ